MIRLGTVSNCWSRLCYNQGASLDQTALDTTAVDAHDRYRGSLNRLHHSVHGGLVGSLRTLRSMGLDRSNRGGAPSWIGRRSHPESSQSRGCSALDDLVLAARV